MESQLKMHLKLAEFPCAAFSDQLRTPLADAFALLTPLEAADSESSPETFSKMRERLYQILRNTTNLELASAIATGAYQNVMMDLSSLANELFKAAASVCEVPIKLELSNHTMPVRAPQHLLQHALLGALRNAVQYGRDGNTIRITLNRYSGTALLQIADNGRGIHTNIQKRMFEPWYSADPYGDVAPAPGIGLGLPILQSTVLSLGGSAIAQSAFGKGTSVAIRLPLAPQGDEHMAVYDMADFMLDRFSPVYVQLCGHCKLPM